MKIVILIVSFLTILNACDDKYKLELSSPKTIQVNDILTISVREKDNKPIDSIQYFLDGQKLKSNAEIDISTQKLGNHAVSATVYFEGKEKKLTNAVTFLAAKAPEMYTYEVINEYPHDPEAFTQGLEFYNGYLYESTGQHGFSSLRKVNLTSGKVLQKVDLDKQYFGEGMTIFGDKIYMLTWQSSKGFIFDRDSFKQEGEFKYNQSKEGWGLTHDAKQLIKSDGSDHIWFLDPGTLQEVSSIETFTNKRRAEKLNELEYINGKIYANIWQQNGIIIVNPENGAIEGIADLSGLQSKAGQSGENYVLNGIAYDKENDRLFVTGKEWNKVFEIKLKPKQ